MKNKKIYTLYRYNQFKNDFEYIKDYYKTQDIQQDFKLKNIKSIYNYINKSIDNIYNNINNNKQHFLQDKYIIIQDTL